MPTLAPTYGAPKNSIAGLLSGDREDFDSLYRKFSPVLLGFIYRTVSDKKIAEDLLIKSFLSIWKDRTHFNAVTGNLVAWLLYHAKKATNIWLASEENITNKEIQKNGANVSDGNGKESHTGIINIVTADEFSQAVLVYMHFNKCGITEACEIAGVDEVELKKILRTAMKNLRK